MRGAAIVLISSLALMGCHSKHAVQEQQLTSTLKNIDLNKKPGFVEQHKVGMFTIGGWVKKERIAVHQPTSCYYQT